MQLVRNGETLQTAVPDNGEPTELRGRDIVRVAFQCRREIEDLVARERMI